MVNCSLGPHPVIINNALQDYVNPTYMQVAFFSL
uniref:Uncharacterized protein n=1 Tax=Anguilla anguilla TaxID=7936 RepID=A0A0E9Q2Y1_ANGAN